MSGVTGNNHILLIICEVCTCGPSVIIKNIDMVTHDLCVQVYIFHQEHMCLICTFMSSHIKPFAF